MSPVGGDSHLYLTGGSPFRPLHEPARNGRVSAPEGTVPRFATPEGAAGTKLLTTVSETPHKRLAVRAIKLALVAFHGWLLFQRVADWSILEPAVLAKWGGAIALVAGTLLFQRFVPRQARGIRAAVVFWLLVLLLHIAPFADVRELEAEVVSFAQLTLVVAVAWIVTRVTISPARSRWDVQPERVPIRLFDARTRVAPRSPPSR